MSTHIPANNPQSGDPQEELMPAEKLRRGTTMSRELALSLLTADDRALFEKFLAGDQDAMTAVKKAHVASALFNAQLHARADKLDVAEVIKYSAPLPEVDPSTLGNGIVNVSMGPGVAVISGNGMSVSPGTIQSGGMTSAQDVQDAINKWQGFYGELRGEFLRDVFAAAKKAESKTGLMTLMDMGLVNEHSVVQIPWRIPGKDYASPKDHDILNESYLISILKSLSIPLIEALVEHAQGIAMLRNGQARMLAYGPGSVVSLDDNSLVKWVYKTQDFLFDERQVELLDKFLNYIGGANMAKPDDHTNPPRRWMTFLAMKADEEDIPTLQMLVDNHNLALNVYDQYGGTPYLRAASMGNLPLIRFLQSNPPIDVLAEERMSSTDVKSALDYAEDGPARRAKEQDYTQRQNEEYEAAFLDTTMPEWEEACRKAAAEGKEPPREPMPPKLTPIPDDYPLEIISIVQEAFATADPNMFRKDIPDMNETKFSALDALDGTDDIDFSGM